MSAIAAHEDERRDGDYVQSLERGLAVLRVFDADHPSLTLSDVARSTGLTRATARRLLMTFAKLGYMTSDGRLFSLTPKVLDLGYAYVSSLQVSDIAQPFMEALSERVHESVSASVLDGDEIVYVARVPTQRIMRIALSLGSRLPAAVTSMGRVLLADCATGSLDPLLKPRRKLVRQREDVLIVGRACLPGPIDEGWTDRAVAEVVVREIVGHVKAVQGVDAGAVGQ